MTIDPFTPHDPSPTAEPPGPAPAHAAVEPAPVGTVATDEVPPVIATAPDVPKVAKPRTPRGAPKWETDARDRVKAAIRKYSKPLADLVARDANEGDTRLLVTDFLCDALGYDKYEDLTTEYQVKGEFADYGVRIDQQLVAFIEVKRCTTKLGEKHLRQVQMYAVNEGVEWVMLTNGAVWQAYHLSGGLPIATDLVIEVNLLDDDTTVAHKAAELFYVTRESFKRRQIDELWSQRQATAPPSLCAALFSDAVLDAMRKELRRSTGYNPSTEQIDAALRATVVRPDCQP